MSRDHRPASRRVGTDHLLLALLDDAASTGAQILTRTAQLSVCSWRSNTRSARARSSSTRASVVA
ncbi:Clp protease N-terminal domain-containing protein [Rhodococcus sp. MSC1_016]|uniref:Clp protease N-terminal domain-containing protein n=1 Tax=Rhodococcus sp. MSC1_016 TaxID=2909266 RepID=UPI0035B2CC9F